MRSDQARPLRCRTIRPTHALRLCRQLEALLQRLVLIDGRDVVAALRQFLSGQLSDITDRGLRPRG